MSQPIAINRRQFVAAAAVTPALWTGPLRRARFSPQDQVHVGVIGIADRLQAGLQRLDQHHHARATTVGCIINGAVLPQPVFTNVMDLNLSGSILPRTANDRFRQRQVDQFGVYRQNIEPWH